MWYPNERQWAVIWFAVIGAIVFLLIGVKVPTLPYRVAIIFLLLIAVNLWRHSRKYPPH
jgi:hypothetical protein